jgi:hypothetical protein
MGEFFGYVVLFLGIVGAGVIIYNNQNYLNAFICFWIGLTIGSMIVMHFKKS